MIAFIDDHREAHGVEPICRVLPIAPSTYHDRVAKRRDPAKLSSRAQRDAALAIEVRRVFAENFHVYGVRKVWRQLRREGCNTARCTVPRFEGVIRGDDNDQSLIPNPELKNTPGPPQNRAAAPIAFAHIAPAKVALVRRMAAQPSAPAAQCAEGDDSPRLEADSRAPCWPHRRAVRCA